MCPLPRNAFEIVTSGKNQLILKLGIHRIPVRYRMESHTFIWKKNEHYELAGPLGFYLQDLGADVMNTLIPTNMFEIPALVSTKCCAFPTHSIPNVCLCGTREIYQYQN